MDFHIHGTYSGATSDRMVFDNIAEQAGYKGLDIVGAGDILHPKWGEMVTEKLERVDDGTFRHPRHGTNFVLTGEVEDERRVHHLLIFPSFGKVDEFRERIGSRSDDINIDGRPSFDLTPPEIVEAATDSECLIGPSHAFTPWTSIFKEFDSLRDCYGDQVGHVDFLELGLSADFPMADRIEDLRDLTFLSNSDAHSPWPNKLGREFNLFDLSAPTSSDLMGSIRAKKNLTLNVGLNPKLGKYHLTACSRCHENYSIGDAKSLDWRCEECGGVLKKGVSDRVQELADFDEPRPPAFRPDYVHTAPLSEIISLALGRSDPHSRDVQRAWRGLVEEFGDEISVLVEVPIPEIKRASDAAIGNMIDAFRRDELEISPGGGGAYGRLEISKVIKAQKREGQKTLSEFGE